MNIFTFTKSLFASLLLAISVLYSLNVKAINYQIDTTFTSNGSISLLNKIEPLTGISVFGDLILYHDTSMVRIILEDVSGNQYMIFEAYPLICADHDFDFSNQCDETYALELLRPNSLIIQVVDAQLDLDYISYSKDIKSNPEEQRFQAKRAADANKIQTMNQLIPVYNMNWVAGDNSIVAMYYEQKRKLFGEGYNLRGYDYYAGGVFEFLGHRAYPKVNPNLVWHFDWRNRHGANDSLSKYWDGDPLGTGWLTSVKDQDSCGSCWAFAAVGATEAIINLLTTYHLDINLSEEQVNCCADRTSSCDSGHLDSALIFMKEKGAVLEDCCPYTATDPGCPNIDICEEQDTIVTINNYDSIITNQDTIRIKLIKNGPQPITFNLSASDAHDIVLSGYEFDPKDSTVKWIYKNSWGDIPPEHGFGKMKIDYLCERGIEIPIFINDTTITVHSYDKDGDSLCFWGIGLKPGDCPCSSNIEDCDDNDPCVGGYDENYNCTCLLIYDSIPVTISVDTIWDSTIYMNHDVIVDSGACLSIKSVAHFSSQAKIIVKQGGKLIIDGGALTNACPNELWGGIEAWGSDTNQYFYQYFGVVNVSNGGTIENARTAIANYCTTCNNNDLQSGGVIRTENAVFRNNRIAIDFAPFTNKWQGQELQYRATFSKSLFEHNGYLNDYSDFEYFIKMQQVNGIKFYGCDFISDTTNIHLENEIPNKYRTGIYSIASMFSVDGQCISQTAPCTLYKSSHFLGLNYGIYALGIYGTETVSVKKSCFDHNRTGIYLSAINYATIVRDTFNVSKSFNQKDTLCGLYLDYCTGYQVEENRFFGNANPYNPFQVAVKKIGVAINNSGILDNDVYNNTFDSLLVGVLAMNKNRSDDGRNGLQIICNDFTYCRYDISVDKINRSAKLMGIREYQGNDGTEATSPANNTFSWVNLDSSDYFNNCENIIYWHLDSTLTSAHIKPVDYTYTVNPLHDIGNSWVYDKEICCPSNMDTIGGGGSIENEKNKMMISERKADSILNILNIHVDGGSTEELISEIQNSFPDDAIFLYNDLLNYSPYLTDTSMVIAINREDVLSPTLITDILSENPQSAKSDTVQQALDKRSNPLTDEQRLEIDQGWFVISAKESLESRLSGAYAIRNRAMYNIIRYFKNDTLTASSADSVISFYSTENNLEIKYLLVSEYLVKGDSTSARNMLDEIPENYILTPFQAQQFQNYESYFNFWIRKMSENKPVFNTDSLNKAQLRKLMHNSEGMLRMLLQNLLEVIDTIDYKEPYLLPECGQKSSVIRFNPKNQLISPGYFKVYPNPSRNYCIIEYSLKMEESIGLIQVINIQGSVIKEIEVTKDNNMLLINLNNLPNGIYLFQLIEGGKKSGIQKMIKN